jgi:hypothetical protein
MFNKGFSAKISRSASRFCLARASCSFKKKKKKRKKGMLKQEKEKRSSS